MANKRMFSLMVIDTDAFLDMPLSTQALYFHLNMRADDDGFIGSPKTIARTVGASEDDLKLLVAKRFVLVFEDGVIVIKHWRMHNTLSKDRYKETNYIEDKQFLRIKENNAYTLSDEGKPLDDTKKIESGKRQTKKIDAQQTDERRTTDAQQTDTDKNRIDKNRIDKSILDKTRIEEDKNSDFTTNNFSCIHTEPASQDNLQSNEPTKSTLISSALRNMINLYFMKKYQSIDNHGFIEHYEARDWMHESGDPILGNYKQYIDEWMSGKKIKGD